MANNDALTSDLGAAIETAINNRPTKASVDAALATKAAIADLDAITTARTIESFGATGDGVTDDSTGLQQAFNWASSAQGRTLTSSPKRTYRVNSQVNMPTTGDLYVDLNGGTLLFGPAGKMISTAPTEFLTTTAAAGVSRRATKVVVANATGVVRGDLVAISSPVLWTAGINLAQHYVVSDVDTATGEVWVDTRIVGDITPAQVAAAGLSGDITVKFYHLNRSFSLSNCTMTTVALQDRPALFELQGYSDVSYQDVIVRNPCRMGLSQLLCGVVRADRCRFYNPGFVSKDEGYANLPGAPGGLGYGYGLLASNCSLVIVRNCESRGGWHGLDFSRGIPYAIVDGYTSLKNAYGVSTHEGCWSLMVSNSKFIGGNGITSRSPELIVRDCLFIPSVGNAIQGNAEHERLIIENCVIDGGNLGVPGTVLNLGAAGATAGYPAYTRSTDTPFTYVANTTIVGFANANNIRGAGTVVIDKLRLQPGFGAGSASIQIYGNAGKSLVVRDLTVESVAGQSPVSVIGFADATFTNCVKIGATSSVSNSALVYYTADVDSKVKFQSCIVDNMENLIRVMNANAVSVNIFDTTITNGRLLLGGATATVKNAINCRTNNATLVSAGATVTQSAGNVVLST